MKPYLVFDETFKNINAFKIYHKILKSLFDSIRGLGDFDKWRQNDMDPLHPEMFDIS